MDIVTKETAYPITINFVDAEGIATVPVSATYSILDGRGALLFGPTAIAGLQAAHELVIPAPENTLVDEVRAYRQVVVTYDVGGTELTFDFEYILEDETVLSIGTNSFQTIGEALVTAMSLVEIQTFNVATRAVQMAALSQAFDHIVSMSFRYREELYSLNFYTATEYDALPAKFYDAIKKAQIIQADYLLGGDKLEERFQRGVMAETTGESSVMFRPLKPLKVGISRRALRLLAPFLDFSIGTRRV